MKASASFTRVGGGPAGALEKIDLGCRQGLEAQARVVVNEWKRQMISHKGGFTTGAFSTGTALNKITIGPVLALGKLGAYSVQVGTSLLYHLFWELGHMNLFTRKYERVPTLEPAVTETREEQQAAFTRAFRRAVGV